MSHRQDEERGEVVVEDEGLGWMSSSSGEEEGFGWISRPGEEEEEEEGLGWISRSGLSWVPNELPRISSERCVYLRVAEEEIIDSRTRITHIHLYAISAKELLEGLSNDDDLEGDLWVGGLPPILPLALGGKLPSDVPRNSKPVVLFPRIYLLGGLLDNHDHRSSDVFSYDVTSPERGWERRCNMICPRNYQSAFPLDGKIYVFGGLECGWEEISRPFGEVYDTELDRWEALPLTVRDVDVYGFGLDQGQAMFIDECSKKKHLLLHTSSVGCLTYDVSAASLTQHHHVLQQCGPHLSSAVVDGILYTFGRNCINVYGYDLVHGESFSGPVRGLELPNHMLGLRPFLFDIGSGRLCVIRHSAVQVKHVTYVSIQCSAVRVTRSTSSSSQRILHASVEFHKEYFVPGYSLQEGCFVF